jgi:hypothetical protein
MISRTPLSNNGGNSAEERGTDCVIEPVGHCVIEKMTHWFDGAIDQF